MDIFFRLLFGHLLADFTFQTNYIAEWKRRSRVGLLVHVLIHPVCYIGLCLPYLNQTWVSLGSVAINGWVAIAIAAFLHWVEDYVRVHLVNRGWPDNTLFYIWDQVIHILVLWFLSPTHANQNVSVWPIIGIFFVIVTHFATVTVWFIEKDIYGRAYPETEEKYISILQRLVVWLAFFLPYPLWVFFVIFLVISFARHIWTKRVDFSWTSVLLGNALSLCAGFYVRYGLDFHF